MDVSDFRSGEVPVNAEGRGARLGGSLSGTNLARAGDYNQRVVLQVIRRNPEITRAEITVMTGLTAPTIANISGRLLEGGLIVEAGRRTGGRGQPATRLRVNADGCFAIGLNIDRDHVTIVSLDLEGKVRTRFTRQVAFAMPADVADFVREGVNQIRETGNIAMRRVIGMGVALPDDLGQVALPHRPPGYAMWSDIDLPNLLAKVVPWSVHVDNDAAAAAIGEAQFGGGLDHNSFFYILVSAGLGGGVVIDGAYYRGAGGRSGEIGFLPLRYGHPGGPAIQDVVSLSALLARFEESGIAVDDMLDPAEALPEAGEAIISAWIDESAEALVPALIGVNSVINPSTVLIGGRLPVPVLDRLAVAVERALKPYADRLPAIAPVRRAQLSRDAPAVGAAILPFLDRILPSDSILMKTS